jgi:hypothetical protein
MEIVRFMEKEEEESSDTTDGTTFSQLTEYNSNINKCDWRSNNKIS